MRAPTNYKTSFGLYKATIKAIETLSGCKRGWWLQNALDHAENGLNDPLLREQLSKLIGEASPKTVAELVPVC
ncbi:hypothetical protein [Extensimonas sp. H3M7-6]|uniref:hypothetical protein n=1 Tax=Extensimonas soli TaxID=3031322 RepID=UPI0023D9CE09|nr:hypothetical protein [Extensimonas sp. H3M7-6]MDF1482043.1 hypothetical protein [Extensimonas sp. H3M7-6]